MAPKHPYYTRPRVYAGASTVTLQRAASYWTRYALDQVPNLSAAMDYNKETEFLQDDRSDEPRYAAGLTPVIDNMQILTIK